MMDKDESGMVSAEFDGISGREEALAAAASVFRQAYMATGSKKKDGIENQEKRDAAARRRVEVLRAFEKNPPEFWDFPGKER